MHKTETIVVGNESVEVDCLMVPFIKWLNEMPSVKTRACCEGDQQGRPYVLFVCDDDEDLRLILSKIQPIVTDENKDKLKELFPEWEVINFDAVQFAACEVKMDDVSKHYIIRFNTKEVFIKFNQFMGT